jgi:hypothetical protein
VTDLDWSTVRDHARGRAALSWGISSSVGSLDEFSKLI